MYHVQEQRSSRSGSAEDEDDRTSQLAGSESDRSKSSDRSFLAGHSHHHHHHQQHADGHSLSKRSSGSFIGPDERSLTDLESGRGSVIFHPAPLSGQEDKEEMWLKNRSSLLTISKLCTIEFPSSACVKTKHYERNANKGAYWYNFSPY